mgnify:CR=1 FL=1
MHLEFIREKANAFPEIGHPLLIRSMKVWHCNYETLRPVSACINLRALIIASFPDASFATLNGLAALEYLEVLHLPKVTALDDLSQLEALSTLRLATLPSWDTSGKVTTVDSLEPLTRLPRLKHLELFGIRPPDKSLSALERCPQLVSVRVSKYPKQEESRFYESTDITDSFAPEPVTYDH